MPRPVTLFTGQWADLPLDRVCELASGWGFDGLELACWGDHFEIDKALAEDDYCANKREQLERHGLNCWTISNHLVGQAVCDDPIDQRHRGIVPDRIWGDGEPEGVRKRAADDMCDAARAAQRLGVDTVIGFSGSSIWHTVAGFPPVPDEMIEAGYRDFAGRWNPIIDVFDECGVRFALEVHPSEIAYDFWTTKRALDAVGHREGFGINFDPSHMVWQFLDPAQFLAEFADRIYRVHVKGVTRNLDGRNGVLSSHLGFGDRRRGWDFVSAGRDDVPWERIIRTLNAISYTGPLSIEWEDAGMDREHGAAEALAFVRTLDFPAAGARFDDAFASDR
jgi:sugar phosphate isomerase/epimerase